MQVSAGFDAHWRDPLAGLQFRTSTFHALASQVKQLADGVAGNRMACMTSKVHVAVCGEHSMVTDAVKGIRACLSPVSSV